MAALKFATTILLILVETCIAHIDSIEFNLGDRKLRVPLTPPPQENLVHIKRPIPDLPDTEDLTHAHVHPHQEESYPLLSHLDPHEHHIQKSSDQYPEPVLSKIYDNYPLPNNVYPPHQVPTNQYHRNKYPQSYYEQQFLDQMFPKQYHQPAHYYSHADPHYPNDYHQYPQLKPNFPQASQFLTRQHSPPYFGNHAYASANYLGDNFHQSHIPEHYAPRSHFDNGHEYARYDPHMHMPQPHAQSPWEYLGNHNTPTKQEIEYDQRRPAHGIISPTENNATQVPAATKVPAAKQNHENPPPSPPPPPQSSLPRRISHKTSVFEKTSRLEEDESRYSRSNLHKHYLNSHHAATRSGYLEQDKPLHSRSNIEEYYMAVPPALAPREHILHTSNIVPYNTINTHSKLVQAPDILPYNSPIVMEQYSTSAPTETAVVAQDISKLEEQLNTFIPVSTTDKNVASSPIDTTATSKYSPPITTAKVTTDKFVRMTDKPTTTVALPESTTVAPILDTSYNKETEDTTDNVPDNIKSPDMTKGPITFSKLYTHINKAALAVKPDSGLDIAETTTESAILITTTDTQERLSSVQKDITTVSQLNHQQLPAGDTSNTARVIPSETNRRNVMKLNTLPQSDRTEGTTITKTTRSLEQDATTDVPLTLSPVQEIKITTSETSFTRPLTVIDALEQQEKSETIAQDTTTPISVTNDDLIRTFNDDQMKESTFTEENKKQKHSYIQDDNNKNSDSMTSNSATEAFVQYTNTDKPEVKVATDSTFDIQTQEITTTVSSASSTDKNPEIKQKLIDENATNNNSDIVYPKELSTTKDPELFIPITYTTTDVAETEEDADSFVQDTITDISNSKYSELKTTEKNVAEDKNKEEQTLYTTTEATAPSQIARRPCKKRHRHRHTGRKGPGGRRRRRRTTTMRPSSTVVSTPVTTPANTGSVT